MTTTYTCTCGATIRYRQDMDRHPGGATPTWVCRDCQTPVPAQTAERIRHQHPS